MPVCLAFKLLSSENAEHKHKIIHRYNSETGVTSRPDKGPAFYFLIPIEKMN